MRLGCKFCKISISNKRNRVSSFPRLKFRQFINLLQFPRYVHAQAASNKYVNLVIYLKHNIHWSVTLFMEIFNWYARYKRTQMIHINSLIIWHAFYFALCVLCLEKWYNQSSTVRKQFGFLLYVTNWFLISQSQYRLRARMVYVLARSIWITFKFLRHLTIL